VKVERFVVRANCKACAGKTSIVLRINKTVSKDFLALLVTKGFIEAKNFTAAGILFVENQFLKVNGTFGRDILNINCKVVDCDKYVNEFETLLTNME
jgi:hypothetical protein